MKLFAVFCKKCGKKLLERGSNGVWYFKFGKNPEEPGKPPVIMEIYGSIRMTCIRRNCDHVNHLDYFPSENTFNRVSEEKQSES